MVNGKYQYVIIGCGIMGLAVARAIKKSQPDAAVLIIDKEREEAAHASGRNSGVLHAGFYYSADSLKAKFTVEGNRALKEYCRRKNLPVNECGKLVVAQNEGDIARLHELAERGRRNGANVEIIDERRARRLDPNVRTLQKALYSPDTASVDPRQVCSAIKNDLLQAGVQFSFQTKYIGKTDGGIRTNRGGVLADKIINCAGLYADKVARDFGFGGRYAMIPFKGLYLKYTKNKTDVKMNIYPVPDLKNPFLGVHFTKTVTGEIKIGPTAIPAFWRENYNFRTNFKLNEFVDIMALETRLFCSDAFGFRRLALDEMRKYNRKYVVGLAQKMVRKIDPRGFTEYADPGIRAQLLDQEQLKLVQDFVIEGDARSTHILNAVSPTFTCAFPFADFVVSTRIFKS